MAVSNKKVSCATWQSLDGRNVLADTIGWAKKVQTSTQFFLVSTEHHSNAFVHA